jgi:predicted Zn-ribbon and HTH transcriptional regulator
MTKQIEVDVKRSLELGYQENGRVKAAPKQDYANISVKTYYCIGCGYTTELTKSSFGEGVLCPDCKAPMIQR